jgi:3-oxoacyl-[acyl-carrier protein] reductase
MDLGIHGKTALVAGGSKGMGRAAARMLGAEGCNVAIVARGQEAIDKVVSEIRNDGGNAIGIAADLATRDGVRSAVDATSAAFGSPDIVIGQTNERAGQPFWELEDEAFVHSFRTFTMSAVYLARAVLPDMRGRKWGRFVHIGSGTAKETETRFSHILANVARPSTAGLMKSLADEVAIDGVTVNTVAPGWIVTPALEQHFRDRNMSVAEGADWVRGRIGLPAGRFGKPEEIASLIVYLCSAQAGYITGEWIIVDGGMHRSLF